MEYSGSKLNQAPWQAFTVSKGTTKGTFTNEVAANKVLRAVAALTLTVKFKDGVTSDLVIQMAAGDDIAFDQTVLDVTTTAEALLA